MMTAKYRKTPAGKQYRKLLYGATFRRCSRKYQKRTHKNKTITTRFGEEAGRVISTRMQAGLNTKTGTVCITAALTWHGQMIYPSQAEATHDE